MNKKLLKTAAVFAMVLFVGVCFGKGNLQVKAASGLQQTEAQKKSVTVEWTAGSDEVSYNIYKWDYSDKNYEKKLVGNTTDTKYTFKNLAPASKYTVYVVPVKADGTESYYSSNKDVVTLPDKFTTLKQEKWWYWLESLDVKWDRQTAADKYEIRLYDSKNKLKKKKELSGYSTAASFAIKNDNVYKVQIRSVVKYNKKNYYSKWGTIYCLNQPMLSKVKISGNKLELKWGKINGATEYRVYVSQKAQSGFKKVATVKKGKNTCTVKKFNKKTFSSKKKYYVYVEAVCKKSGTTNTSGNLYRWNTKQGGGTSTSVITYKK